MSFAVHLNAVIIAGVCCIPAGLAAASAGLIGAFGTGRHVWLTGLGAVLIIGGIAAVLVGAGMAIK